jgi:hypothetical protein
MLFIAIAVHTHVLSSAVKLDQVTTAASPCGLLLASARDVIVQNTESIMLHPFALT